MQSEESVSRVNGFNTLSRSLKKRYSVHKAVQTPRPHIIIRIKYFLSPYFDLRHGIWYESIHDYLLPGAQPCSSAFTAYLCFSYLYIPPSSFLTFFHWFSNAVGPWICLRLIYYYRLHLKWWPDTVQSRLLFYVRDFCALLSVKLASMQAHLSPHIRVEWKLKNT